MTRKTTNRPRTHHVWTDTTLVVSQPTQRAERPPATEQPAPVLQNPAEKEAERWVAQMMFENYNP